MQFQNPRQINDYVQKRHEIADLYDREFASSDVVVPLRNSKNYSALHLYVVQVDESKHKAIFQRIREKGIGANIHYIPVHTQPYYQKLGFSWGDYPNSENYYKRAISLPMYPTMTECQQDKVIQTLHTALQL